MTERSDISYLADLLETVFKVNDIKVLDRVEDPATDESSEMITYTCKQGKKTIIFCMAEAKE